ncbi:butyrate--acetoacetate CoA-transferase subunit B [Vibrio sp. MACH09]|uniref:3-oxoacid CoA-transferase subunit B n=1 Tax=unclassified Vibrio TaxID=2614977 RepID=UPI0014933F93|nr:MULTISPECIES: 3-oxoacid CoA-transferase subunit B [unclassified Vibrio]NOI67445.1 3-oxoacid CoA-transferase subunit B [Vibrio sp. 99-8-1]GLO60757.1 butyrate--acetoacetate CoA-transferase subunit B [Vibrio sp. MACH09]
MNTNKTIEPRERIAKRVAKELKDGYVVNLGIGLPTMVADQIDNDVTVLFQSENGLLGIKGMATEADSDPDLVNAGGQAITAIEGAAYFNSSESFAIIRGGHVDATVLGALQVDQHGNLANWIIPGKMVPGMGGAMDLVVGAKKVIVAMEHTVKGKPKLLNHCTLPLTAQGQVNLIVTELAVIEITANGMTLIEIAEDTSVEEVQSVTEATLIIADDLKVMA